MSLQELYIKTLEKQIVDLTRDCHYLLSLLNSAEEIDWDNWAQGKEIKEHLEQSKFIFEHQTHKISPNAKPECGLSAETRDEICFKQAKIPGNRINSTHCQKCHQFRPAYSPMRDRDKCGGCEDNGCGQANFEDIFEYIFGNNF